MNTISLDEKTKKNVEEWLNGSYDEETKKQLEELLEANPQEIIDAFYTNLEFGTAGMRGVMGIGSNRMNIYTVRIATQGLANYLNKQQNENQSLSVLVGYDSRLNSRVFALEAARVLAANQIHCYLFQELRPLPLVSFGCRLKNCQAAIMITASHNPPEYNGYKVFWNDGAQVLPPHDKEIIEEVKQITSIGMVKTTILPHPLITFVKQEIDDIYLEAINPLQNYPEENRQFGSSLQIVYSSLHGTGTTMVPKALKSWGFTHVHEVERQKQPDSNFPTISHPNPEDIETLKLGIELLMQIKGDLLLATDADCDRIAVVVNHKGGIVSFTGNQIACLCAEHLCEASKEKISKNTAFIKTIVTTDLFQAIVESYGASCFNVLTGFKYIAEKIREWERDKSYTFVFGAEESFGYLLGTLVRDKDAVISAALICEMALHAKLQGKTLLDKLHDLYKKYGIYREKVLSIEFEESKNGQQKIKDVMTKLRNHPPHAILGTKIIAIEDYQNSVKVFLSENRTELLSFAKSNAIVLHLADGSKLIVRPSGTEPKIKLYCSVLSKKFYTLDEGIEHCDVLTDEYLKTLKNLIL